MKVDLLWSKGTEPILYNGAPILVVEFSPVTQVFMHDGGAVVDMFRAEDMRKFMNQSNSVRFRFGMCAGVTKWFIHWRNDVITQPVLAIADPVDPRPTSDKVLA